MGSGEVVARDLRFTKHDLRGFFELNTSVHFNEREFRKRDKKQEVRSMTEMRQKRERKKG